MTPDDDKPLTPAQARQKLQMGLQDYLAGRGSEAIVFRHKRTKKASHTYPLKLTPHQREALLRLTRLGRTLTKKLEGAGDGTQIVPVTWNELHTLNDETGQAAVSARNADKKRLLVVLDRVVKFFGEEHAEVFDPKPAKADRLFQIKITLANVKPAIWRRIQIPDCTLLRLNKIIQACMGWEDYHMWLFEIGDTEYGEDVIDAGCDRDFASARKVKLSRFIQAGVKKFWYTYDMGDDWGHVIQIEKLLDADPQAKYPLCLEGKRACPPEDCGGPPGYVDYLEAIADPEHKQHEEMLKWRGPFDPEAFDAKAATNQMREVR